MTKTLKIEDISPGLRWGWVDSINGMGSIKDQKIQVIKFVEHAVHIFENGSQTMLDAAKNGSTDSPPCALVVVGVRALGKDWGHAFSLLAATGDCLYSISTNNLYTCSNPEDFEKATREYRQQVLIPAREALKASGKKSGPRRKLDKAMLADIQLRRNTGVSLTQIRADILEQYGLPVSEATMSRRTSAPALGDKL